LQSNNFYVCLFHLPQLVSITNHTLGTVCCVWMTGECMEVESVGPLFPGEGNEADSKCG